ncbi:MAG: gluconate 5-dehydrogenase [Rhizobiales bacterium 65-9]|nr:glucose 1-dehydrogenase [Hyphomicrobiales bacterium]OJY36136.1 MAG: gluconate 5-dehydrogenase [Rhizobiales bacterium 65-9]
MALNLFNLEGRVALVTGSSQGIGFSIAKGLAQAGAHVVLNGRDADKLGTAREAIAALGLTCHISAFDVTSARDVAAAIEVIEEKVGPIDILVNNAGAQKRAPFVDYDHQDWDKLVATNLTSVFYVAQAVAKRMVARKRGKIINIASVMSELGRPTIVPYTATKGAVKTMTRALAAELGPQNIQVNAIGPGYFATELNKALIENPEFNGWVKSRTPAGRWGETDELIGAAVFLASSASDYVNGHLLMVDGGLSVVV